MDKQVQEVRLMLPDQAGESAQADCRRTAGDADLLVVERGEEMTIYGK